MASQKKTASEFCQLRIHTCFWGQWHWAPVQPPLTSDLFQVGRNWRLFLHILQIPYSVVCPWLTAKAKWWPLTPLPLPAVSSHMDGLCSGPWRTHMDSFWGCIILILRGWEDTGHQFQEISVNYVSGIVYPQIFKKRQELNSKKETSQLLKINKDLNWLFSRDGLRRVYERMLR